MVVARICGGKKFMWDGKVYQSQKEAEEVGQRYRGDGFEVELVQEGQDYLLFTRRVVK